MKKVCVEQAVGMVLGHDLTKIVPGEFKGAAFRKGHIIKEEDIPVLLSMGKDHIYIIELKNGLVHENDAAERLAKTVAGEGVIISEPVEAKVNLRANYSGVLKVNAELLSKINTTPDMALATLPNNTIVTRGEVVASVKIIPLAVPEDNLILAAKLCDNNFLIAIHPLPSRQIGLVVTGNEVFYGRIEDKFAAIIRDKMERLGCRVAEVIYVPDDEEKIKEAVLNLHVKYDMVFTAGGMSVDPDDVTPKGIRLTGAEVITYGTPVLPGAMFLVAYLADKPILGIPACGMFNKVTVLDIILPKILTGEKISKQYIASLGHGGLCRQCGHCRFPNCSFGKNTSNSEEAELREDSLFNALSVSLPIIAKVAGGEAVLFDKEGRRLKSVDPGGVQNEKFIGKVSKAAMLAMKKQQPVIGESTSVIGAMAVRIPITSRYGLGFNNEMAVSGKQKLIEEVKKFQFAKYNLHDIIGESDGIKKCKTIIGHIAGGISSVLINGATGTGKELFAQAIHNASDRRDMPFIAINCGALPSSLIESNLFGYTEGSFTGAKKGGAKGIFEAANNGTVFLDEISEMDWDLQAKLLRVLQEREVTRIGSTKTIPINVRIIASTNKNLHQLIQEKKFREDLYYRLNVVELKVPALRDRREDIPLLARFFIDKFNSILGKNITSIDNEVYCALREYSWPGNVRELQNAIESALNMVAFDDDTLRTCHLPAYIFSTNDNQVFGQNKDTDTNLAAIIESTEKQVITRVLKQYSGNRTETAEALGLSVTTLWRKLKAYGIE